MYFSGGTLNLQTRLDQGLPYRVVFLETDSKIEAQSKLPLQHLTSTPKSFQQPFQQANTPAFSYPIPIYPQSFQQSFQQIVPSPV